MLNTFSSLQHIDQLTFQGAWQTLSENLSLYRGDYETEEDFISYAPEIVFQFPDYDSTLTDEDCKAIALKVWQHETETN